MQFVSLWETFLFTPELLKRVVPGNYDEYESMKDEPEMGTGGGSRSFGIASGDLLLFSGLKVFFTYLRENMCVYFYFPHVYTSC